MGTGMCRFCGIMIENGGGVRRWSGKETPWRN